jgi:hypothetical protein
MIKFIQAPLLGPPFLGALHRMLRDAYLQKPQVQVAPRPLQDAARQDTPYELA